MSLEDPLIADERRLPQDDDLRLASAGLIDAAKTRILQLFDLAAAEARLAAMSSLSMLLLVIVAAAALIIAWMLVVALAIYVLVRAGVSWPIAASGFALVHVGVAYFLWCATAKLSRNLTLPELRRAIMASGNRRNSEAGYVQVEAATGAR